jgi:hypothetical protein
MIEKIIFLIRSLLFSLIVSVHYFLNIFSKIKIDKKILFIDFSDGNPITKPLEKGLLPSKILAHNPYRIYTFFRRKIKNNLIPFNRFISLPFFYMTFSKERLDKKRKEFYGKNMYWLLRNNEIKKIVLQDEYSLFGYSVVSACKKIPSCKSFALQHGIISPIHPGYIFPKKIEKSYNFPDYLITYGDYEKELLTKKSCWNPKIIVPLGCPRYDFLKSYKVDKNKLKDKLGIPKDKKVIFWATQTHDPIMIENGENKLNIKIVFETIEKNKDWFLLIKFHPNENKNKSFKFYYHYKNKYNLDSIRILDYKDENTFDCICLADLIILTHSTVGMESLLMNKPIINLATKTNNFLEQYAELKSCLLVKKNKDLNKFLRLIQTKEYKDLFKKERKKYLKSHFSNLGFATKKIIKFIKSI